jgi:ferredoxin-type protein NapH
MVTMNYNVSFFEKHKFKILRNLSYLFFLVVLIALPYFKIVKLDVAHGESYLLGKPHPATDAFIWIVLAIGGISILIVFTNLILGRVFCGWICPGGLIAEIQEYFRKLTYNTKSSKINRLTYILISFMVSVLLNLVIFNWITDLRVFFFNTNPAFVPIWIGFLFSSVIFFFEVFLADKWCRVYCPTGIYHKITPFFHFSKPVLTNKDQCLDCKACIKSCPMGLDPRKMAFINDFDRGIQACIECGECVDACAVSQGEKGKEKVLKFINFNQIDKLKDLESKL